MANREWRVLSPVVTALAVMGGVLPANAADVALLGTIGKSAILSIDGGRPRTVKLGAATREGVRLLSLDGDKAVVEVNGERQTLELGMQPIRLNPQGGQTITL